MPNEIARLLDHRRPETLRLTNVPVSIQIDQVNGGRLSGYAFTVDLTTLDTTFIQALPQQ